MTTPQAPIQSDRAFGGYGNSHNGTEPPEFVTKTPNRTFTNASEKQVYKPAPWQSMRPGADDNQLLKSKGF